VAGGMSDTRWLRSCIRYCVASSKAPCNVVWIASISAPSDGGGAKRGGVYDDPPELAYFGTALDDCDSWQVRVVAHGSPIGTMYMFQKCYDVTLHYINTILY
jgi:hypothetical protein